MAITIDEVRWIATLARLELSDAELTLMAGELSPILDYFDQLKSVPTDGVEPLAHPLRIHNVFREDEPAASLSVDDALSNPPARSGNFFSVPPVLE